MQKATPVNNWGSKHYLQKAMGNTEEKTISKISSLGNGTTPTKNATKTVSARQASRSQLFDPGEILSI